MERNIRYYQQLKHILSLKTYINSVFLVKCKIKQENAGLFLRIFYVKIMTNKPLLWRKFLYIFRGLIPA